MTRLIDADALKYTQQVMYKKGDSDEVFAEWFITATEIDNAPTIDAVPVRHGRWDVREPMPMHDIKGNLSWGNWYVCTGCGFATTAIEGHITQYKYCPSCGARMDGEDDES